MSSKEPDSDDNKPIPLVLAAFGCPLLVVIVYGCDLGELFGRTREAQIRFFIMLGIALICAVTAHAFVRRWFRACLVSGAAFSLLVQTVAFLSAGHLDPFFPIALVLGCFLGFAVAAPVGLVFHIVRSSAKRP